MITPPPDDCGNDEDGLNLPAFVAHLLNVRQRPYASLVQSDASLGDLIVDKIAVMTGFFSAGDPEGQEVVRLINERSEGIYVCLYQAQAGIPLTPDDLNFLQR